MPTGRNRRDVIPHEGGWASTKPGASKPESTHSTQYEAQRAAKKQLADEGGGEVRIHSRAGAIRDRDTVGAAECPRKDRRN